MTGKSLLKIRLCRTVHSLEFLFWSASGFVISKSQQECRAGFSSHYLIPGISLKKTKQKNQLVSIVLIERQNQMTVRAKQLQKVLKLRWWKNKLFLMHCFETTLFLRDKSLPPPKLSISSSLFYLIEAIIHIGSYYDTFLWMQFSLEPFLE